MSQDVQDYINKIAKELALAQHQSRDREVSGLFKEISANIKSLKNDLTRLERSVGELQEDYKQNVLPNVNTWNKTSENQNKVVWFIILAVIAALLGARGLGL